MNLRGGFGENLWTQERSTSSPSHLVFTLLQLCTLGCRYRPEQQQLQYIQLLHIWQHKAHNLFVSHCNREKWIPQIILQCFRDLIICGCANANVGRIYYSPSCALMCYCIQLSLYLKVITFSHILCKLCVCLFLCDCDVIWLFLWDQMNLIWC